MNRDRPTPATRLRSTLGYLEREAARRAEGGAARALRLHDDELAALVDILRREVGTSAPGAKGVAETDTLERGLAP